MKSVGIFVTDSCQMPVFLPHVILFCCVIFILYFFANSCTSLKELFNKTTLEPNIARSSKNKQKAISHLVSTTGHSNELITFAHFFAKLPGQETAKWPYILRVKHMLLSYRTIQRYTDEAFYALSSAITVNICIVTAKHLFIYFLVEAKGATRGAKGVEAPSPL